MNRHLYVSICLISLVFVPITFADSVGNEWMFNSWGSTSSASDNYQSMGGSATRNTLATMRGLVPISGSFTELRVLANTDPGAGSWTFPIDLNGVDQTNTCSIVTAALTTTCTFTVAVVQGDQVAIHDKPASAPTATRISTSVKWVPTTPGQFFHSMNTGINMGTVDTTVNYWSINGSRVGGAVQVADTTVRTAVYGHINIFKVCGKMATSPGAGSRTVKIDKNGSGTGTGLTMDGTAGTNTTCQAENIDLNTLDTLAWVTTIVGTPTNGIGSFTFAYTGDGFLIPESAQTTVPAANRMIPISGAEAGSGSFPLGTASEVLLQTSVPVGIQILGLAAVTSAAPGATDTNCATRGKYTFDARRQTNTAANNFEFAICGTDTTGSAAGTYITVAGDLLATSITAANTPATVNVAAAYLAKTDYTALPSSCTYHLYNDFHGGTNGANPTNSANSTYGTMDNSDYGITGIHQLVTLPNDLTFSTSAHKALGGTIPHLCNNDYAGAGDDSTLGLIVNLPSGEAADDIRNTLWSVGGTGNTPPGDTAAQVGALSYWFMSPDAPIGVGLNVDSGNVRGGLQFTNMAFSSDNTTLRLRVETGGSCHAASSTDFIAVTAGTWYRPALLMSNNAAAFDVTQAVASAVWTVTLSAAANNTGNFGYQVGDVLVIKTNLTGHAFTGAASPANDLTITVASVDAAGAILTFTKSDTSPGGANQTFTVLGADTTTAAVIKHAASLYDANLTKIDDFAELTNVYTPCPVTGSGQIRTFGIGQNSTSGNTIKNFSMYYDKPYGCWSLLDGANTCTIASVLPVVAAGSGGKNLMLLGVGK